MVLTVSVSCKVHAPAEIMWELLQDVQSHPLFRKEITKVEFLKRSKNHDGLVAQDQQGFEFKEGSAWKEYGDFAGKPYESIESITCIRPPTNDNNVTKQDKKEHRKRESAAAPCNRTLYASVQINSQFINKNISKAIHTGTFTILREEGNDNNGDSCVSRNKCCVLQGSMAFLPGNCFNAFKMWIKQRTVKCFAECHFRETLQEYAVEAEKRHHANSNAAT